MNIFDYFVGDIVIGELKMQESNLRRWEFLKGRQAKWFEKQVEAKELVEIMESNYEGSVVVAPPGGMDEHVGALIEEKEIIGADEGVEIQVMAMEVGMCHSNASKVWLEQFSEEDMGKLGEGKDVEMSRMICSGYVLYEDKGEGGSEWVWRQHSWVVTSGGKDEGNQDKKVIMDPGQSTGIRYFGHVMSDFMENYKFAYANI